MTFTQESDFETALNPPDQRAIPKELGLEGSGFQAYIEGADYLHIPSPLCMDVRVERSEILSGRKSHRPHTDRRYGLYRRKFDTFLFLCRVDAFSYP